MDDCSSVNVLSSLSGVTCPVCFSLFSCPTAKAFTAPCSHTFCVDCLTDLLARRQPCPVDRHPLPPSIEQCVRTRALEAVGEAFSRLCHEDTALADAQIVEAVRGVTETTEGTPSSAELGSDVSAADVLGRSDTAQIFQSAERGESELGEQANCPICLRSLTALSEEERSSHANACLDEYEKTTGKGAPASSSDLSRHSRLRESNIRQWPNWTGSQWSGIGLQRRVRVLARQGQELAPYTSLLVKSSEHRQPPPRVPHHRPSHSFARLFIRRTRGHDSAQGPEAAAESSSTRRRLQAAVAVTKSCGHFCCLTLSPRCCACADGRRREDACYSYRRHLYSDGRHMAKVVPASFTERRRDYCPTCRTAT